jgi:hypothetical protein
MLRQRGLGVNTEMGTSLGECPLFGDFLKKVLFKLRHAFSLAGQFLEMNSSENGRFIPLPMA